MVWLHAVRARRISAAALVCLPFSFSSCGDHKAAVASTPAVPPAVNPNGPASETKVPNIKQPENAEATSSFAKVLSGLHTVGLPVTRSATNGLATGSLQVADVRIGFYQTTQDAADHTHTIRKAYALHPGRQLVARVQSTTISISEKHTLTYAEALTFKKVVDTVKACQ